jgi:hypothetical protein
MDTHVNALFKNYLTDEYDKWLKNNVALGTDFIPKPTKKEFTKLVKQAWDRVPSAHIIKGFKQNGLSLALNTTEDHLFKINFERI